MSAAGGDDGAADGQAVQAVGQVHGVARADDDQGDEDDEGQEGEHTQMGNRAQHVDG